MSALALLGASAVGHTLRHVPLRLHCTLSLWPSMDTLSDRAFLNHFVSWACPSHCDLLYVKA